MVVISTGLHISRTRFRTILRWWLIGIVCLVLVTVQMMFNLCAVQSNQDKPVLRDGLYLPPLNHNRGKENSIAEKPRLPSPFIQTTVIGSTFHRGTSLKTTKNIHPDNNPSPLPSWKWSIETSYFCTSPEHGRIRQWGCQLSTTPLIFVHIGKSGGGSVRARLAASSLNYTKKDYRDLDFSYYPLPRRTSDRKRRLRHVVQYDDEDRAQFCDSGYNMFNLQPSPVLFRSLQCKASTPLGQAIACPELYHNIYDPDRIAHLKENNVRIPGTEASYERKRRHPCFNPPSSDHANLVFASHHNFGAEVHWLPARMLSNWWNTLWASPTGGQAGDSITRWLRTLEAPFDLSKFLGFSESKEVIKNDRRSWCKGQPRPIFGYASTTTYYQGCSDELCKPIDRLAQEAVSQRLASIHGNLAAAEQWSTLYASLPVLRVTLLRDPFSWLCSKFFWHQVNEQFNVTCDDLDAATHADWTTILQTDRRQGWASRMALQYLQQVCGDDCVVRSYNASTSNLQEIELQASANLRQGFAVVGVMSNIDEFYDMLNKRVAYLNTSLNPHVVGERHESSSASPEEAARCKRLYRHNRTFQKLMLQSSPEVAALERLYRLGVEVNRFQRKELEQCSN